MKVQSLKKENSVEIPLSGLMSTTAKYCMSHPNNFFLYLSYNSH